METLHTDYDLVILDGAPHTSELGCMTVGDIDGDGNMEVVTGGSKPGGGGMLLWYRPATFEKGIVAEVDPHVGLALEDIDGDGIPEIISGHRLYDGKEDWAIVWIKRNPAAGQLGTVYTIDALTAGGPHDLVMADVDGDGENELVADAMYTPTPGLYVYKRNPDPTQPWQKFVVQDGFSGEGTLVSDFDGDGRVEIISGPYMYIPPNDGPFSGPWKQVAFAPSFREMCRADLIDITGNGRMDVVIVDSEYPDGRLSWFENRMKEDAKNPWIEHPIDRPWNFAHSLTAWKDPKTAASKIFVAEMAQGGWNPPYNWDARLAVFTTTDQGKTWSQELVYHGAGTHQALAFDLDKDGEMEFVGEETYEPHVLLWKRRSQPSPLHSFKHYFLDREKPWTGTDILAVDVDGDGLQDVVCSAWWYRNPGWERYQIPGIYQVHTAYDIDGDGRQEIIASRRRPGAAIGYPSISNDLCWLKAVDPLNGIWEEYSIGQAKGDWAHGSIVAPVLPGGKLALLTGYHSAGEGKGDFPEIWTIPDDPKQSPWPKRVLAEIKYGEEFVIHDMDGDGKLDIVAGRWWLKNMGDGTFKPIEVVTEGFPDICRVRVSDVNHSGYPDIIVVEEKVDYRPDVRKAGFVSVAWFENPGDPGQTHWKVHVIDTVRSPHSLDIADLDGDGKLEIIVGEHDPFKPYRNRSRLYIYKAADPQATVWYRTPIEDRFEHHDGTKVFEVEPGKLAIISHGWQDVKYVHLWKMA
jgi:hypothetical protein